jgi:hypothetical protein
MLGRPIPVDAALAGERVIHGTKVTRAGTAVSPPDWHSIKQGLPICNTQDCFTGQLHFAIKIIRHFTFSSVFLTI